MDNDYICIHCYVTGRVQGVFFRASTQDKAKELGLTGWVKNLPDGRVEVIACGERQKVEALYAWLQNGPMLAKVTHVSYEEIPWQDFERFGLR